MKRFGSLAILVFALYLATIIIAPYHYHQANAEHVNCKLCQVSSQSSTLVSSINFDCELHDFGFLPAVNDFVASDNSTGLKFGRAPPTISL